MRGNLPGQGLNFGLVQDAIVIGVEAIELAGTLLDYFGAFQPAIMVCIVPQQPSLDPLGSHGALAWRTPQWC